MKPSVIFFTAALLGLAAPAAAQTPAEEAARGTLIARAQKAHAAGDHKAALDFALRAGQMRRSPTLLLFTAEEQSELGLVVDAYASAQQCLRELDLDTHAKAKLREETGRRCRALGSQLETRVAHLVVNLPTPPPGISVKLSGNELNQAAIGIPYLITPGEVTIEATAPGYLPYSLSISVPEGKTVNVTVTLAPTPCPPVQHRDGTGKCVADLAPPPPPPPVPPPPPPPPAKVRYGLIVGGVGAAALVTSGVAWLVANGRFHSLKSDCGSAAGCEASARHDRIEQIKSGDQMALGLAITGGVLFSTGAVIEWVTHRPTETRLAIDPVSRTLQVGGRF